ncbi:MAG: DUF932 domain-containing protein [Melioribacteraceae bacterium]|nr:DUF932 domain-containing protein [Melioribacteraceae bacterium]
MERMEFPTGKSESFRDGADAIDFLRWNNTENIIAAPESLAIKHDNRSLYLTVFENNKIREFPIRRAFLEKLLKWYSFPIRQLDYFDIETVAMICNDYLMNMKSNTVAIKIEWGDALTIKSDKYVEVSDLELISNLKRLNIESVLIDDYTTTIKVEEMKKIKPFPGDEFGMGLSVQNSETGFSAVRIKDFLLRYVCTNGAYVANPNSEHRFYHYNLFVQDIYDRIDIMINEIGWRAEKLERRIQKMETPVHEQTVAKINKDIFHRTAIKLLNDVISTDRTLTFYELFNLITERAKEFDYTKRRLIEEVAGRMIVEKSYEIDG